MSSSAAPTRRSGVRLLLAALCAAAALFGAQLVAPQPAQAAGCPSNAVCLYTEIRYGGPLVPYQPLNETQSISPRDAVSSWQNTSGRTFCAYDSRVGPDTRLFVMSARDRDDWVGHPVNDKADYFKPC